MRFSEAYNIDAEEEQPDWFDPILFHDTKLFIDPFLVFWSDHSDFEGAHEDLITFFNRAFQLGAESGGRRRHPSYRKLEDILVFPEVEELGLGYTAEGRKGSGSGEGYSRLIASGIMQSIALGITEVDHFEEIDLFHEGIGPDRISDITANILKPQLFRYTEGVCERYNIPRKPHHVRHAEFDFRFLRWRDRKVLLPVNPEDGNAILLVPKEFLRTLPTICPEEFWEYMWDNKAERLRNDFNYELKSHVNKTEIIEFAKVHRFEVREFIEFLEGEARPTPYDLRDDPKGLYQWAAASKNFVQSHPLQLEASSRETFVDVVQKIAAQYKLYVEANSGYKLLWDGERGKSEEAAQLLFLGVAKGYCKANDVDVSRETNLGSGPVDFKFSRGYENRALLEVKLARNGRFWNGIRKQLPAYLEAEEIKIGFYLVVAYTEKDFERIAGIQAEVQEVAKETNCELYVTIVDATKDKLSASKL